MPVRVGIIDSGISAGIREDVVAARNFCGGGESGSATDGLGHGSAVAALIAAPGVELCVARVFDRKLVCSAADVAAAIDWLLSEHVSIINMSFGLRQDRTILREACERALGRGVCLVAASPARGDPVYPAKYPGVVRATGDARCAAGDVSRLDSGQADFGAYAGQADSGPAGASIGCASVTAALAALAVENPNWDAIRLCRQLGKTACFKGPEQRVAGALGDRATTR